MFFMIVFGMPLLGLAWWIWADRTLAWARVGRPWRIAMGVFVVLHVAVYAWLVLSRMGTVPEARPAMLVASTYVWHLIVLPVATMVMVLGLAATGVSRWRRGRRTRLESMAAAGTTPVHTDAESDTWTRRRWLGAVAAAAPPVVSLGLTGAATAQLDRFRVRPIDVPVPGLPSDLDGLTIAHVSDIHAGRFTSEKTLRAVVERVNAMRADLVLLTGDLIDYALADLPGALDAVKKLDARHGVYMCEGNHDLFQDADEFVRVTEEAGVALLRNQTRAVRVRGVDVELLGLRWGSAGDARRARYAEHFQAMNVQAARAAERADTFRILLSHHPHAFDPACEAGIPLTLAGHTHGGQLMLGNRFGAGPMLYKYWSGLYTRGASSLVVSNGVGNWFPLRTFAPAEIVRITLRRADGPASAGA